MGGFYCSGFVPPKRKAVLCSGVALADLFLQAGGERPAEVGLAVNTQTGSTHIHTHNRQRSQLRLG